MIINATQYAGACACGNTHKMTTRLAVIEAGCLADFDSYAREQGLTGRRAAIYDENTYHAQGLVRPRADQEIILPAADLLAGERAVAEVLGTLRADTEVLVAVGGGTVHDIVRFCAHKLSLPFIACPTAASVDGYASGLCAMVWRGTHRVLPGVAPTLVLADENVLAAAPRQLTRSGIGEALAKYTALTDWRVAHLLTGEPLCPVAEALMLQTAVAAQGSCSRFARGDDGAVAQLMYALLLSGLSMQMLGAQHPASGAEHHLSHLMHLLPEAYGVKPGVLHGEQVGVATIAIADLYHRIGDIDDIAPLLQVYKPIDRDRLTRQFGESLAGTLLSENEPDSLAAVDPQQLTTRWESIRRILAELPPAETLSRLLRQVRGKTKMKDIGIPDAKVPEMLEMAPYIRNQLTLLRTLRLLRIPYEHNTDASHAPSRSKRYADSAITRAGSRSATSASSMR